MLKFALYNLTTTTKHGGLETRNWEMAASLARRGCRVDLYGGLTDNLRTPPPGVELKTFPFIDRGRVPNLGTRFRKMVERLSFAVFASKSLIEGGYDYIYLVKPYDFPAALRARAKSGAKIIYASGGEEFFLGYRSMLRRLDWVFANSEYNAGQIEDYSGRRPLILRNGVNVDLFRPMSRDRDLARELNLGDSDRVLISACRLVGWKGIRYAVLAAGELKRIGFPVKYLVIGDGEDRPTLEALVRERNLSDVVLFLGRRENPDLPRYYSLADLALFPPVDAETFGIALGEALACGVPVIGTRVGGIPELVVEGTGLLTPPRDETALAEAAARLLRDDDLRKGMGRQGRKLIETEYSWEAVAGRMLDYISQPHRRPEQGPS